jgi:hypothetical protein
MLYVRAALEPLTETEAKLVARSNARLVEMPVVYVKSLGIVVVPADDRSAVVGCLLCDGVRKFAAGRCRAVQNVDEAVAQLLTRQTEFVSNGHDMQSVTTLTQPIRWLVRWRSTGSIRG